jgi:hypothetical protein
MLIIVERNFEQPLSSEEMGRIQAKMAPCLNTYRVRWVESFLSADRQRMICHYEAADAAAVRDVQRESDAPFERIWTGEHLRG